MSTVASDASAASSKRQDSLVGLLEKPKAEEAVAGASQLSVKKANKGQRTTRRRKRVSQLEQGQKGQEERPRSAQPAAGHKSGAAGAHQLNVKPGKTTRVRINSTSEQIEDPNWLQQRLQQQQKLGGHLRQLQHKFKMTITGQLHSPDEGSVRPESAPQPPSLPVTPAKVPVSILKQRSRSPAASTTPPALVDSTISGGTSTPTAKHRLSNVQHPSPPNPSQLKVAHGTSNTSAIPPTTGNNLPITSTTHTAPATTSLASSAGQEPKMVPLCAEGQVKVSGWRRKNLLAKTLCHLDEIRGNQMPVFVPTKICLPSNSAASPSSGSKFVDVVRQAMATKRTSSTPAGALTSDSPTSIPLSLQSTITKVSSSLSNPEAAPTKRASIAEMRANSADPSQQLKNHQQQPAHRQQLHQHRSSSSGLVQHQPVNPALSPKQQVTPPIAQQTSTNRSARTQHLVVDNSARLYKLAHKNQQLLHNLRRQSNEHQPSAVSSLINATRTGNISEERPTAHLKDWKRLASKLALLTTGGRSTEKNLLESNQLLRVFISNDEASSLPSSTSNNNSSKLPLLSVPSGGDRKDSNRKLSSSSMFGPSSQRLSSDSGSQPHQTTSTMTHHELPRRSSDSEAYKRSSIGEYLAPETPKATEGADSNDKDEGDEEEHEQAAVVVRGDDLLQILQVASIATGASGNAGGGIPRRSLQLEEKPEMIKANVERKNSTHSMEGLVFHNREQDVQDVQRSPLVPLSDLNSAEQPSYPVRRARKDQLSSLVKKTTKVVFLQEKLRKIRWRHSTRATNGASSMVSSLASDTKAANEESKRKPGEAADDESIEYGSKVIQHATNNTGKGDPSEVLMNPTLIGDAIEIFLRSSMQNKRTSTKEDEAPIGATLG